MGSRVVLLTRGGCHLCVDAKAIVADVCLEAGVPWEERDVDADATDKAEHGDYVPVVLVDGVRHGFWRIEADRLRAALA